jgi:N-acetylmuramoyl-L-alanine amidase
MRATPLLACLLLSASAAAQPSAADSGAPAPSVADAGVAAVHVKPPVVFVDAGHGGKMDGASGPRGVREKAITLQIAKRLKQELEKRLGAKVLLTRDTDVDIDIYDRMRRANEAKAEVFVSVHCNAMPPGPYRANTRGIETYFLSAEATGKEAEAVAARENAEARKAQVGADPLTNILNDLAQTEAHHDASLLAYAVHQRLIKDLGTADRGVHQAPFIVLMGAEMPAILVEAGFLTSPAEAQKLVDKEYQTKIADSLVDGIVAFLGEVANRHKPSEKPK